MKRRAKRVNLDGLNICVAFWKRKKDGVGAREGYPMKRKPTDKERLDWFGKSGTVLWGSAIRPPQFHAYKFGKGGYGRTVRQAIDAAMRQERRP